MLLNYIICFSVTFCCCDKIVNRNNLKRKRFLSVYRLQSTIKKRHCRASMKELGRPQRNIPYWLASRLIFSYHSYTTQTNLPRAWARNNVLVPLSISNEENACTEFFTGQSNGSNSLIGIPSSQVTLAYVMLIKNNQHII